MRGLDGRSPATCTALSSFRNFVYTATTSIAGAIPRVLHLHRQLLPHPPRRPPDPRLFRLFPPPRRLSAFSRSLRHPKPRRANSTPIRVIINPASRRSSSRSTPGRPPLLPPPHAAGGTRRRCMLLGYSGLRATASPASSSLWASTTTTTTPSLSRQLPRQGDLLSGVPAAQPTPSPPLSRRMTKVSRGWRLRSSSGGSLSSKRPSQNGMQQRL